MTIGFGQIFLSKPNVNEIDGTQGAPRGLIPNEARLRNLTYQARIYVDMSIVQTNEEERKLPKVGIGKVPIMLRSQYCQLSDVSLRELPLLKECPYDEGASKLSLSLSLSCALSLWCSSITVFY